MACALATQLSRKAPGSPGYEIGGSAGDVGTNLGTKMKYIGLISNNSQLACQSCTPTGSKCKISLNGTVNDGKIDGSPDPPGAIVNSYVFDKDETLNYGLAEGMFMGVNKMFSKIGKSDTLNFSEDDICRQYSVGVVRNDNGKGQAAWCTISDDSIKNMDQTDIDAMTSESQILANQVRNGNFNYEKFREKCENNGGTWDSTNTCVTTQAAADTGAGAGTGTGTFQNMKGNKLNPQNLTFDDDIPMKVYYALLGVGGIYLLYQLSKKYGIKLNID